MSNTVKWGILSTANIAKGSMVPAIHAAENAELLAVASESGKAEEAAAEWGAEKHYNTYEELLQDSDIDAVYIPLPNALHKKWMMKAAGFKKHVLVEKPAAVTADDVLEMDNAAKENSVLWMEGFMYQFHPQHAFVKQLMNEGAVGTVKKIRASFSFPLALDSDNIRLNHELAGGSLFDVGCYCVNVSRLLLEEEPLKVISSSRRLQESGVDISTTGILTFNKADALIDCSFDEANCNRYEVIGTKGSIEVPYAFRPDKNPNDGKGEVIVKDANGSVSDHQAFAADQFTEQVRHFSDSIISGTEPVYSPESTYNNMKVIEALYKSQE